MLKQEQFMQAFYAAKGAYALDAGGGFLKHLGYEFVEGGIWTIEETGLKAALYSDSSGHYILAFCGTEGAQDWYQNLGSMGFDQWDHARSLISETLGHRLSENSNFESLTITGHSLGGGLSQYAAYDLVGGGVLAAEQIKLVTFNALGAVLGLEQEYGEVDKERLSGASIYHYFEPSDLVVKLSEHLGGQTANYHLINSSQTQFFLDAHVMSTIEAQIDSAEIQLDAQANIDYFNLQGLLPLIQALASGANSWFGGEEQEASELEAVARLFAVLPGITAIEAFPLKPQAYGALRDWVLDNVLETKYGVEDANERSSMVFSLGAALGGVSAAFQASGLATVLELASQFSASFLEYLYASNDDPDLSTPAKDILVHSMFSLLSGAELNAHGVLSGGQISRDEVQGILDHAAPHEATRYREVVAPLADILGMSFNDSLEGYIEFHHALLDQGLHFAHVSDASRLSQEQISHWLNYQGHLDMDGRLARFSVMHNLPFILMGPENETQISEEIRFSPRYAQDTYSEAYWQDRLDFYQLTLSRNQSNLPYGKGGSAKYALYEDLDSGLISKNYYFADSVSAIKFGSEGDDLSGLTGGAYDDRLYGGGGDDILVGAQGDDYLEGGAGNDSYHFSSGDGWDYISDVEGSNAIVINGTALTKLEKVSGSETLYLNALDESDQRKYLETPVGFSIISATGSDAIHILGGSEFSDFGIEVTAEEPSTAPESGDLIIGNGIDIIDPLTGLMHEAWPASWAINSGAGYNNRIVYDANIFDQVLGHDMAWGFWGAGGHDRLYGGEHADTLRGGLGDDILLGELGADSLYGQQGNDVLSGGGWGGHLGRRPRIRCAFRWSRQ